MFDFPHILTRPWAALRRASSRPLLLPLASLCLGASSPALAQGPVLAQDRGSATGLASIEGLGLAVATNGAVGAVSDLQGRVHVYDLSTPSPILLETLLGPRGVDFGFALDWQGDRLAVGAPRGGPDGSGAVYLYRRGGAGLLEATQAIVAPVADQTPETRFGHRLRFKDQRLAVGAPGAAEGRVYVFDSSGELYVRTQSLQASDGLPGDRFGAALDWKLDCMVIGAPSATVNASTPGQGVLYVFREGSATLMEEVKLSANGATTDAGFGTTVGTDGVFVVGGAPAAVVSNRPSGRGYVFVNGISGWTSIGVLGPTLARPSDFFAASLSMRPGLIVVGAPGDDTTEGVGSGSYSVFSESNGLWSRRFDATPTPADSGGWAGSAVDLDGGSVFVAAPGQAMGAGTVWARWIRNQVGTNFCGPAANHSAGFAGQLRAYGSERLDDGSVGVVALSLPPKTFGVLLVSDSQDMLPGYLGSQGTLCLGQPFGVIVDQVQQVDVGGSFQVEVPWQNLPVLGSAQVGQSYSFQAWFRDWNPGPTTNFSEGLTLTLQ